MISLYRLDKPPWGEVLLLQLARSPHTIEMAPMKRLASCTVLFLFGSGLLVYAQQPPADPDAKGTITLVVDGVDKGKVTVKVTRGASAGWSVGPVGAFACKKDGGVVYSIEPIVFPAWDPDSGDPPPATGTASITLPNGEYVLWANHEVSTKGPPASTQRVGSALVTVTVTESTMANPDLGGNISHTPVRVTGGAGLTASGTVIVANGWQLDEKNAYVNFYTVPTGGGLIRSLSVPHSSLKSADGVTWPWSTSPNIVYVPSQLKYNTLATTGVRKTDKSAGQAIGSSWIKDK
jgi:hypothetical protein